ncbi:Clan CA, family C19, ubiquitin hydrolase-like cysteine peptidase [Tritrichomonas foetus]|uniref:ubiquitinyl hydrolase 1 n=1 Tax=Tritrichomonas foetus TaxID=1144522 RepID=A0A1J4J5W4_9EUKA|nr:Clan CA, family C19, ubiquitin hydrolase-like cysteine peptidase [Tritrichomonas foetus]|eukprot:OHS94624.1 Clan CA, family C19, ubiquitin hydrolase-like cysteine peptidase [Tritrichomonas foetus]
MSYQALHQYLQKRSESALIEQDPYEIHETWETCEISKMSPDGAPSPAWKASDKYWRIICYPKGYKSTTHLSILLYSPKLQEEHKVKFTIQTVGGIKTRKESSEYTFSKTVPNRGFFEFIPLKDLDLYTVNGKLKFDVHIIFSPPKSNRVNYRKLTGYIGLENQGCTCYMNSMLQCLFHTGAFRKIVFGLPTTGNEDSKNIPLALQRLFTLMQKSPIAPSTKALTDAFGWSSMEVFMQHDVQEFLRVLIDNIETKMKKTDNPDAIARVFRGKTNSYVKCLDIDYSSDRVEDFYDISLVVQNKKNLLESLDDFITDDYLVGKNQYQLEDKSFHDAFKGCRFKELPPVLHIHLQRFAYDMMSGMMKKVRERFEFPFELDMEPYLSENSNDANECTKYELFSVLVHQGEQYGGHYFAYCRPTTERKWVMFNDDQVSIVPESQAMDDNFGGYNKHHSAYFLAYIRKTDIDSIMHDVTEDEIPNHLLDYFDEWKSKHSGMPPSINLRLVTDKTYTDAIKRYGKVPSNPDTNENIKSPGDIRFTDFLSNIKRTCNVDNSKDVTLWTIDKSGYPKQFIKCESQVKQIFPTSSRMFVSDVLIDNSSPEQFVPLIVTYYDPTNAETPLQYIKFAPLKQTETLLPLKEEIRKILNIPETENILTFYSENSLSATFVSINNITLSLSEQSIKSGMIIFQKENIPNVHINEVTKTNEDEIPQLRVIDLLPDQMIKTVDKFFEFNNSAISYSFAELDNSVKNNNSKDNANKDSSKDAHKVAFRIALDENSPIKLLQRSVRSALNVSESDSILLFKKNDKDQPSERPIDFSLSSSIKQIITVPFLFYKVIPNVKQSELENRKSFRICVVDENLDVIEYPMFLMSSSFQVDDVFGKIKQSKIVPYDKPLRMLQLQGSRIVKMMEQEDQLSGLIDFSFRAEVIPEDQLDAEPEKLVRVTLTNNKIMPRNGCVGTPFYIKIEEGEAFKDTKERLVKMAKVSLSSASFAYSNECTVLKNFKQLNDDDVLSDILKGRNTMLYVFVPGASHQAVNSHAFNWNSGVRIYN